MKYACTKEFPSPFYFPFIQANCFKEIKLCSPLVTALSAKQFYSWCVSVCTCAVVHTCMFRQDSTLNISFCFNSFYSKISNMCLLKKFVSIIFRCFTKLLENIFKYWYSSRCLFVIYFSLGILEGHTYICTHNLHVVICILCICLYL